MPVSLLETQAEIYAFAFLWFFLCREFFEVPRDLWPTWTFLSCKRIGLIPLVNCSDVTPSISCKQFVLWTELKGSNIISYSWIALKHNPLQIKTATAAGSPAFDYFRTRKFKHEIRSFLHMISLLLYVFLKLECCWGLFGKGKVIILHSFWKERQLFSVLIVALDKHPKLLKVIPFLL